MRIQTLTVGSLEENAYIADDGREAIVVDPGGDVERIRDAMGGLPCRAVLLTHAHYDHIGAVAALQRDGAKVYLHRADAALLRNGGHLAALFSASLDMFMPDVLLDGGETLAFCNERFHVMHTPGHTQGSVCYVAGNVIFAGDTLFRLSVGRTDFPTGDAQKLHASLDALFALPQDRTVLPGHGPSTTLSFEKKNNPYV